MEIVEHIIIGAGPAGLATAGRFRKAQLKFQLLEKSQQVGSAWRNHYDRLHLHTVKRLSHLPHLPFPEDYPTYVPRKKLVDYFEQYIQRFEIQPVFGQSIQTIKKEGTKWLLRTSANQEYLARHVVVATGINRLPNIPEWPGQEQYVGTISHSVHYKNPQPYLGKKVLVVGIGNTGAEVALDLSEHGIEVSIVARGEISLVPRDLNGRPVQETAKKLAKLPFGFGDWLGSQIRKIYFGNLSQYGLKISKEHPVVLLRETGKTPLIDIGTIAAIKAGKIKVVGDISSFHKKGVKFSSGEEAEYDAVLLATGYRAKLEDFIEQGTELLDAYGCPKSPIGKDFHQGLYFVGFDNYKLGGILGTIHDDSKTVVDHILQAR